MALKILYGFFCLFFLSFALAQYNDPDGITWVLLYTSVAVLFGFGVAGRFFKDLTLGMTLVIFFAACLLFPDFLTFLTNDDGIGFAEGMSNAHPYIERMREFGGLMITAIFLGLLYFVSCRKPSFP